MYTETFTTLLRKVAEQHMLENPRQCPYCKTHVAELPGHGPTTSTNTSAKRGIIKCIREDTAIASLREDGAPGFGLKEIKDVVDEVIGTYTLHIAKRIKAPLLSLDTPTRRQRAGMSSGMSYCTLPHRIEQAYRHSSTGMHLPS